MILGYVKVVFKFVLERSGVAEVVRQMDVVEESPMFRMYYDIARMTGATHRASLSYAKCWSRLRA